ncbi:unnamed protein product [Oikopleura dioica]|uniref:Mitochondrial import inner membrane translocase subunit n=1 Tax=Oikopleura dioica TaxID=34765 RepID=E4WX83_OIKDI|nr:unnamed protein product [Oikopleura dioica]
MADQAQAIQAIQQLAAQDPEIQKLQAQAQFKSVIHGHTDRCWEKCNLGKEATQSSLSGRAKSCLDNCVRNFFTCEGTVNEVMQKMTSGNK